MSKVGIGIGILGMAIAAIAGLYLGHDTRDFASKAEDQISQYKKTMGDAAPKASKDKISEGETIASRMKWGSTILMLAGLIAIGLIVSFFVKPELAFKLAIAVIALGLIAVFLTPGEKLPNGAAARARPILFLVVAAIGAIGAFLNDRKLKSA